jgi:hypothetical protein
MHHQIDVSYISFQRTTVQFVIFPQHQKSDFTGVTTRRFTSFPLALGPRFLSIFESLYKTLRLYLHVYSDFIFQVLVRWAWHGSALARLGKERFRYQKNRLALLALAPCAPTVFTSSHEAAVVSFLWHARRIFVLSGLILPHLMVKMGGCYDIWDVCDLIT